MLDHTLCYEIFKRDQFACARCGEKPPASPLCIELLAAGARDERNIGQYITSCHSCIDPSSLIAGLPQLADQLDMLLQWQHELAEINRSIIARLSSYWAELVPGYPLTSAGMQDLQQLVKSFDVDEIMTAMRMAAAHYLECADGLPTHSSVELTWSKVGGICRNRQRERAHPHLSKIRYICGILDHRLHYFDRGRALELLALAVQAHASVESIEAHAKTVRNWSTWRKEIEAFITSNTAQRGRITVAE